MGANLRRTPNIMDGGGGGIGETKWETKKERTKRPKTVTLPMNGGDFDFTPEALYNLVYEPYTKTKMPRYNWDAFRKWFNKFVDDGPGRVSCEFQQLTQKLQDHGQTCNAWAQNRP
uniref:Retrotransposon gag domain-containing protein n=1 Tax=Romanomermis culicivorax TaxID=13658 RepID=A0A915JK48_ROMCU